MNVDSFIEMRVPGAWNGPDTSAHGGYVCGRLATAAVPGEGAVPVVTLLAPIPLETPLRFRSGSARSTLWHGAELLAHVAEARTGIRTVPPVTPVEAARSARSFLGREGHPYPRCRVCGPDRPLDGLRLEPGGSGPDSVACPWVPQGAPGSRVEPELVWAVLDCPSGWVRDPRERPAVLTRMAAEILWPVVAGRPYVVVARQDIDHGRSLTSGSALYDEDGALVAKARAIWTSVDSTGVEPGVPRSAAHRWNVEEDGDQSWN